ncbi:hypothetical protein GCM10027073_60070 [Streptomyces chlorus]
MLFSLRMRARARAEARGDGPGVRSKEMSLAPEQSRDLIHELTKEL